MATVAEVLDMAKRGTKETMPIRLTIEAIEAVRIAASFKGVSQTEYASQVLLEAANKDIEEGYLTRSQAKKAKDPK